jgi:Glycosyl transferases group 1
MSPEGEIPFRIYGAACSGALFLTDPLGCGIETLFDKGREYLTYNSDLSDLEEVLVSVSGDPDRWLSIRVAARERVRQYSWPEVAERYVVPALRNCLEQA